MDFSNLDLRKVENMKKFCYYCDSLVSVNFTNTQTLNVTSYKRMFGYCANLTSIELPNFKTSDINIMFYRCPNSAFIDIRAVSCKKDYDYLFTSISNGLSNNGTIIINDNCSYFIQEKLPNWNIILG